MARRKKGLSLDEKELWDRVTRTARPLSKQKPFAEKRPEPVDGTLRGTQKDRPRNEPTKPFRIGEAASHPALSKTDHAPAPPVKVQPGTHRKLIRGKLKPEARIDLHGMTVVEAHPALIRFMLRAWDDGLRLVLVITGKGRGGSSADGPIPERRGVLRQQVPGWLQAPPLGAFVVDVREAHARHGGDGAYYVYLRRRR